MAGNRRSFWMENTIFGLLMGAGWCVASLLFLRWGKGMAMNPTLNNVLVMMAIAGVYLGLRDYRERGLGGVMGYWQGLGRGLYMVVVAAVVYGVYTVLLLETNAGVMEGYRQVMVAAVGEMAKVYGESPMLEAVREGIEVYLMPVSVAVGEFFNHVITGGLFTACVAALVYRRFPRKAEGV